MGVLNGGRLVVLGVCAILLMAGTLLVERLFEVFGLRSEYVIKQVELLQLDHELKSYVSVDEQRRRVDEDVFILNQYVRDQCMLPKIWWQKEDAMEVVMRLRQLIKTVEGTAKIHGVRIEDKRWTDMFRMLNMESDARCRFTKSQIMMAMEFMLLTLLQLRPHAVSGVDVCYVNEAVEYALTFESIGIILFEWLVGIEKSCFPLVVETVEMCVGGEFKVRVCMACNALYSKQYEMR